MQATLTTGIYDAEKNIVIPQQRPEFNNFKQVLVLFVPQKKDVVGDKVRRFEAIEKIWQKNLDVDPEEAARDIKQAIAEVRAPKRQDS